MNKEVKINILMSCIVVLIIYMVGIVIMDKMSSGINEECCRQYNGTWETPRPTNNLHGACYDSDWNLITEFPFCEIELISGVEANKSAGQFISWGQVIFLVVLGVVVVIGIILYFTYPWMEKLNQI